MKKNILSLIMVAAVLGSVHQASAARISLPRPTNIMTALGTPKGKLVGAVAVVGVAFCLYRAYKAYGS